MHKLGDFFPFIVLRVCAKEHTIILRWRDLVNATSGFTRTVFAIKDSQQAKHTYYIQHCRENPHAVADTS
jgi:hypothetical protein